jgi:hypothetical protein
MVPSIYRLQLGEHAAYPLVCGAAGKAKKISLTASSAFAPTNAVPRQRVKTRLGDRPKFVQPPAVTPGRHPLNSYGRLLRANTENRLGVKGAVFRVGSPAHSAPAKVLRCFEPDARHAEGGKGGLGVKRAEGEIARKSLAGTSLSAGFLSRKLNHFIDLHVICCVADFVLL